MTNPLVSILIPLYNAEKYFDECIQSVLEQTYKNIEVIIVNDGSTDNSLNIANMYAKKYSFIKVIDQENKGAASARNKAFPFSSGEYIQYLDADDILHPDKIAMQIRRLNEHEFDPEIVATSAWSRFFYTCSQVSFPHLPLYQDYSDPLMFLRDAWQNNQNMIVQTWLTPRKLHIKAGHWDEGITTADDNLFFAKIVLKTTKILFVSESKVYWRQDNPNSLSSKQTHRDMSSYLKVCHSYHKMVKKQLDYPGMRYALAMEYSKCIYRSYPEFMDIVKEAESTVRELGFDEPLPMPTWKFRIFAEIIGFYPAARVFGFKDKIIKTIRRVKG